MQAKLHNFPEVVNYLEQQPDDMNKNKIEYWKKKDFTEIYKTKTWILKQY